MLICPDCRSSLPTGDRTCPSCNWAVEIVDDIAVMLSSRDRASRDFAEYAANYDQIAADDLESSIQDEEYLEVQTNRLFGYLGETRGLDVCDVGIGKGL